MNYREIVPFVASAGRALFFSVITVPAVMLFVIIILISLRGSLTGWYINDARSLVGNAPAGMVMRCLDSEPSPTLSGDVPPPQYVKPEPCTKTPVAASGYASMTDSTLLAVWKLISMMALAFRAMVWASGDSPSKLSNIFSRRKRDVTDCNHDK